MSNYSEALAFAAAYCSSSEHCKIEILDRINRFELSNDEQEKIIERLEKEGFLNEKRYVKAFVNDRFRYNKWGRVKIRYMLKQKRIEPSLIDECMEVISENEYHELLLLLLKQKRPTVKSKNPYELRGKMLRFAAGRGFEPHIVSSCLKELDIDEDTEDFL